MREIEGERIQMRKIRNTTLEGQLGNFKESIKAASVSK